MPSANKVSVTDVRFMPAVEVVVVPTRMGLGWWWWWWGKNVSSVVILGGGDSLRTCLGSLKLRSGCRQHTSKQRRKVLNGSQSLYLVRTEAKPIARQFESVSRPIMATLLG